MPRNSSGTYTLATSPVVSGTAISSTWANDTLADIAQGITDSLDRQGRGGMLAPFEFDDGTVAAPGATFGSEPTSGLYRAGAGDVRVAILGQPIFRWNAGGAQLWDGAMWNAVAAGAGQLVPDGTVQGSVLRWDENTDQAWEESNALTISDAGNVVVGNALHVPNGSAAAPTLTFTAQTDMGLFRKSATELGVSVAGAEVASIDDSGNLVVAGNVDGVDVAALSTAYAAHAATANIHFADSVSADGQLRKAGAWVNGVQVVNALASGKTQPTDIQVCTQAQYDASSKDANTVFLIVAP